MMILMKEKEMETKMMVLLLNDKIFVCAFSFITRGEMLMLVLILEEEEEFMVGGEGDGNVEWMGPGFDSGATAIVCVMDITSKTLYGSKSTNHKFRFISSHPSIHPLML